MKDNIFCTIFTPTYNRKKTLKRLYSSLCKQELKNFEWIIVDDGSTDGTEDEIKKMENEKNDFEVIYIKQENGGKHRAINKGLEYARGKVFAIVDSDDYLTDNATKKIQECFVNIESRGTIKYAGVAFQKGYDKNNAIGNTFNGDFIDAKSNERSKYKIEGDKFEIFYTRILKENRFPEIENEKFVPEALVWTRIAAKGYYLRWFNDIIYMAEYLEGGLTDRREEIAKVNPKGYALYIKEQVVYGNISRRQKLGYYSFYYKSVKDNSNIMKVAKELDTNIITLAMANFMRMIIENIRSKNGKRKKV